jgi:hypothetical protein
MRDIITPVGDGTFELNLPSEYRGLLSQLTSEMQSLLAMGEGDDARRLFPVAHTTDDKLEEEYQRLTHDPLLESHLVALDVIEETIEARVLDEAQLSGWMRALNGMRLVIGTRLDVSEDDDDDLDPDDPRAHHHAVYHMLGLLLEVVVSALTTSLPPPEPDFDLG